MNGIVLYDGPSLLTGERIVCAVVKPGSRVNRKTGRMLASYIFSPAGAPATVAKTELDESVCGSGEHRCPFSGLHGCYAATLPGTFAAWRAHASGAYPHLMTLPPSRVRNWVERLGMRLGAYGDPLAVPRWAWDHLLRYIPTNAASPGYTHQWDNPSIPHLDWWQRRVMASVESPQARDKAKSLGWRTYRTLPVLQGGDPSPYLGNREVLCPSERGVTCVECGGCNGAPREKDGRVDFAIPIHGIASRRALAVTT